MLRISALRPPSIHLLSWFAVYAQNFNTLWLSQQKPTEMLHKTIKENTQTVKILTDVGLPHQDRDARTTFPTLTNLISPTSGIPFETATIGGIALKFASQITPKTTNETEVPVRSIAMKKMQTLLPNEPFQLCVQSTFQWWQNWPLQARMPCPTPKFKRKAPTYQQGNCAGNSKNLQ